MCSVTGVYTVSTMRLTEGALIREGCGEFLWRKCCCEPNSFYSEIELFTSRLVRGFSLPPNNQGYVLLALADHVIRWLTPKTQ